MTPAPASGRTADENELRNGIIAALNAAFRGFSFPGGRWSTGYGAEMAADALLSGPLAPILQEAATARKERDESAVTIDRFAAIVVKKAEQKAEQRIRAEAAEANLLALAKMYGEACWKMVQALACVEDLSAENTRLRADLRESAMQHIARDLSDEQAWTEIAHLRTENANLRDRVREAEKGAEESQSYPSTFDEALAYIRPPSGADSMAPVTLNAGMLRCCVSAILMRAGDRTLAAKAAPLPDSDTGDGMLSALRGLTPEPEA